VKGSWLGGVEVQPWKLEEFLSLELPNLKFARDRHFEPHPSLVNDDEESKLYGTDTSTMVINPTYLAQRTRQCASLSSN
jgi:hypothetical protein